MRIESPAFTERDLRRFLDEVIDRERLRLAERLEAASDRLAELVRRGVAPAGEGRGGDADSSGWSGHDVLVHIAVVSKFYGIVTYQVGSGKLTKIELLELLQNRDVAGEQLTSLTTGELLAMARHDHQRTLAYLRSADAAALQRRAVLYEGVSMSAWEIAELPLCAHLETHLDQLERALPELASGPASPSPMQRERDSPATPKEIAPPRYFEDFQVGAALELGSLQVSEAGIIGFARQYDPQPMHLDPNAAGSSIYGGLIASGWHTGALFMRLLVGSVIGKTESRGSPGMEELRWPAPVRPGDTLSGRIEVIETRASSSRPTMGIVRWRGEMRNQDGRVVMSAIGTNFFGRRPPA